jgi:NAD(P)H-flavin reductase
MKFEEYLIEKIKEEGEDVRLLFLKSLKEKPNYLPGQFFLIQLQDENGKAIHRPYSVASAPWEEYLQFCIKKKGFFPQYIWKLKEKEIIKLDGPYGIFLLQNQDKERVFIGGGVGISALRPMILQTTKEGKPSYLFHSAHTKEGLKYFEEMKNLAKQNPSFQFFPSISGEVKEDWDGLTGRISVQMLKEKLKDFSDKTFYICGSKDMASSLSAQLMQEKVPKERIKKDEWG